MPMIRAKSVSLAALWDLHRERIAANCKRKGAYFDAKT
jgi:hypothetical protein